MDISKIDNEVMQNIEKWLKKISAIYSIEKVLIFGSCAKGNMHEYSDIDIAVVSNNLKNAITDSAKMMALTWGIDTRIEPHAFHSDEFKNIETPFIQEIINTGIEIYKVG